MTYDMDDFITEGEPDSPPETIRTQADLERLWRHLMEPLGFGSHSIWLLLIDADDRPVRRLTQVEDVIDVPSPDDFDSLIDFSQELVGEQAPGGRVAFLRSRPGRGYAEAQDREMAAGLVAASRRAALPIDVVHLANDAMLVPLPQDDLPQDDLPVPASA